MPRVAYLTARSYRGTPLPPGTVPQLEQKSRELTAEIQRVAREDEQLLRDLVRLDELKQLQAAEKGTRAKR